MHIQNWVKLYQFSQGLKLCYKCAEMLCNNLKPDLVNINAYAKFGNLLSICSKDIEQKQNDDGQNDRLTETPIYSLVPL